LRHRLVVSSVLALVFTVGPSAVSARERPPVAYVVTSVNSISPVTASFAVAVREACQYAKGHRLIGCIDRVFATHDNGGTWTEITPRRWPRQLYVDDVQFLDGSIGWIADVSCVGPYSYLYRTRDGGATWRRSEIDSPGCQAGAGVQVSFSDAAHGWLVNQNPAGEYTAISRTTDGGATWLGPFGGAADGYPANVVRLGPGRGLGTIAHARLVGTGRYGAGHWVERPLPRTARYRDRWISLPRMFGHRGVMTASLTHSSTGRDVALEFLTTDDGGQSWTVAARIPDGRASDCPKGGAAIAPSPRVWWMTCRLADGHASVRGTTNAGASWNTAHRAPPAMEYLNPVDDRVAWAVAHHGEGLRLFVTEDGGTTWHRVRPA